MSYERPITIKEVISDIQNRKYVLPSIQREFVWSTEQVEILFDSLMRDYPIGTFLFWKVDKDKIKDFQFYEFLKKYDERSPHNDKADLDSNDDVIAVLDGQQRLTSIYLALNGNYTERRKYARIDDNAAYQEKYLYLNLLAKSEDVEKEFEFKFLTDEEVDESENKEYCWFKCCKILEWNDVGEVGKFVLGNERINASFSREQKMSILSTLQSFFNIIHQKGTVNYYQEKGQTLDKVLQIFIRTNSGGTPLSSSDLLLSIATAQWKDKDAREVIYQFVNEVNNIGDSFDFNKDIILKSCLVLSDISDIKFKVDNFNPKNMEIIESNWEGITVALRSTVELISKFGYSRQNLIATNAIIPIAYFIFKNKCGDQILRKSRWEDSRQAIKKWLARVLLKGVFGGQPDSIYPGMRELIKKYPDRFPLQETIEFYKGKRKSISFNRDEIDNLLDLQHGKAGTYCALTLIYPDLDHSFRYHQDHIHPKSSFNRKSMRSAGFSEEQIEQFNEKANSIANLQLLGATDNMEKNNKPFKEWFAEKPRGRYLEQHHIDPDQSLEFEDFMDFVSARRNTLKKLLMTTLGVTSDEKDDEQ